MPKAILTALLALTALVLSAQTPEIRAIWVLPWSMDTPQKIDAFIAGAAASKQTDVYVEVRYRADALYQTNRIPDDYPNPEPRSHVLDGTSFDPLQRILKEAHKRDLHIIMDLVLSHSSDQHRWFRESLKSKDNPFHDWYIWRDPAPDGGFPEQLAGDFRRLGLGI